MARTIAFGKSVCLCHCELRFGPTHCYGTRQPIDVVIFKRIAYRALLELLEVSRNLRTEAGHREGRSQEEAGAKEPAVAHPQPDAVGGATVFPNGWNDLARCSQGCESGSGYTWTMAIGP